MGRGELGLGESKDAGTGLGAVVAGAGVTLGGAGVSEACLVDSPSWVDSPAVDS